MKKSKLILSVATLCLAIAVLCFGVYAVQSVNYSLGGNITYQVTDAFVEVQTKIYKSTSYLTSAQIDQKVREIAGSSITTAPTGLTLVDTSDVTNSTSGALTPYRNESLSFSTQEGSECYAYFFVTSIKNMSTEQNVWAVMEDELTNPANTVQINNGLQQTIDTTGKNMVIGVGLDNLASSIPADTSAFNYGIKIGIGELATQDFNLAKLTFNNGTVAANRSNMNGVVVIPDTYNGQSVTTIKNSAPYPSGCFSNTNFTTIVMSDNIVNIEGEYTFYGNTKLTNIIFSQNLESMGKRTFGNCPKLSSVEIPSSVTSIGDSLFYQSPGLTEVTIPSTVTSIGSGALRITWVFDIQMKKRVWCM